MRISAFSSTAKRGAASCGRPDRPHAFTALAAGLLTVALLASCTTAPAGSASGAASTGGEVPLLLTITQQRPDLPHPVSPEEFPTFFASMSAGPLVPGLVEGAVPQGLAVDLREKLILISAYFDGPTPSAVFAVDRGSGELVKTIWLATEQGEPLHGHVGGIAVGAGTLWVASDEGVYRYPLGRFLGAPDGSLLRAAGFTATPVVASFATYDSGTLWIGEFAYYGPGGGSYRTDASHHLTAPDGAQHHALLAGYRIDPADGSLQGALPERVISIPDRVQGAAFLSGRLYLSLSYGRRNKSTLLAFDDPLPDAPAGAFSFGSRGTAKLWFVDRSGMQTEVTAPPMMEGIAAADGRLLALFESGAEKYRYTGLWSVDHLYQSKSSAGGE